MATLPIGTQIALKTRPGSLGFRMDDWPVGVWTSNVVFTITEHRQGSPPDIPPWYVARFGDDETPIGVDVEGEGVEWDIVGERP